MMMMLIIMKPSNERISKTVFQYEQKVAETSFVQRKFKKTELLKISYKTKSSDDFLSWQNSKS